MGDITGGDQYIEKAHDAGRPESFCWLRKAIARYHKANNLKLHNDSITTLEEASEMLKKAERTNISADSYSAKNLTDIIKYKGLTANRLKKFEGIKKRYDSELRINKTK